MSEILRIAVGVATPLSLLALVATLGYFAFTRRLTLEEERLRALPPDQRAPQTDEYLTRYGIDGKDLSPSAKLSLIRDEMQSRHRRSVVYVAVASLVFVVCFAIAVFAYVSQRNPTDPLGDTTAKEIGFIASNLAEPFAVKGQFGGKANVTERDSANSESAGFSHAHTRKGLF